MATLLTDTVDTVLADALERGQLSDDLAARARVALLTARRPTLRWTTRGVYVRQAGVFTMRRAYFVDGVRFHSESNSLYAAWLAVASHDREAVHAIAHCRPGAKNPDVSIREGLRNNAAWLERQGFGALASIVRRIHVRQGVVRFDPSPLLDVLTAESS